MCVGTFKTSANQQLVDFFDLFLFRLQVEINNIITGFKLPMISANDDDGSLNELCSNKYINCVQNIQVGKLKYDYLRARLEARLDQT